MYHLLIEKSSPQAKYKRSWRRNKRLHRSKDLPAVEYGDGLKCWYENGLRYEIIKHSNGTKEYYDWLSNWDKRLHRFDGPAIVYSNGDFEYWLFGKRHREHGPAVVYSEKQYWFENGEFIKCM